MNRYIQSASALLEKVLHKGGFARDVGIAASGQVLAQIIAFLTMPVLTRIFSSYDIGIQGVFLSTTNLIVSFMAFCFPTAIVLPDDEDEAISLIAISLYATLAIGIIIEIIFILYGNHIFSQFDLKEIEKYYHLIVLSSILFSIYIIYSQYFIRHRLYGTQSRIVFSNSVLLNGARIISGLIYPSAISLILASVAGNLCMLVQYVFWSRKRFAATPLLRKSLSKSRPTLWRIAWKYRDFPLLRTPQVMINMTSQVLPLWLLARYSGAESAGQYAVAIALLAAPTALVGKAINDVFYPRLIAIYRAGESPRSFIAKTTWLTLCAVLVPYGIVSFMAPWIFKFVYGPQWVAAGQYAQWLSFWCMLQVVNRPAVAATAALKMQGGLLIYEIFSAGSKVAALWLGFALLKNDIAAVALFSISGIIAYLALIIWVIVRSDRVKPILYQN